MEPTPVPPVVASEVDPDDRRLTFMLVLLVVLLAVAIALLLLLCGRSSDEVDELLRFAAPAISPTVVS